MAFNEEKLWTPDNNDGTFTNPVIYADYSDPDVIRVGDTYYMTASSFNYTPGLPILISKDMVNWELVNYATVNIEDNSVNNYDIPQASRGIWAPALRYHNGEFYIYYGMPDEGIFMVKTKDPLGKWDDPVLVLRGKGLIDSCPVWDGDKAYIVHGYAKSRIGFKSFLGIFEMSLDGTKAVSDDKILYDGLNTNHTIEGPKVYKIDDYFYILAPAGGVKKGWQTALKSKNIYGPFEEAYTLATGDTIVNGPHQGSLVDDIEGNYWFLHFQDRGLFGRITHVQPVRFTDGWPVMGEGENTPAGPENEISKYCGKPVITYKKPSVNKDENDMRGRDTVSVGNDSKPTEILSNVKVSDGVLSLAASDDFSSDKLGLQWQWTGNGYKDFYALTGHSIKLFAKNPSKELNPTLWVSANTLTQKIICPFFDTSVVLDYSNLNDNEQAGLTMMGGDYAYIAVRKSAGQTKLVLVEAYTDKEKLTTVNSLTTAYVGERVKEICDISKEDSDDKKIKLGLYLISDGSDPDKDPLKAVASNMKFGFYYEKTDGTRIDVPTDFFPSDHTWVGAKSGIFTLAFDNEEHLGFGEFSNFVCTKA